MAFTAMMIIQPVLIRTIARKQLAEGIRTTGVKGNVS